MKLYTEEQVRKAWNTAYVDALALDNEDYKPIFYDDFIASLTPIQLPSDEEIEGRYYKELEERKETAKNFSGQVAGRHPDMFGHNEVHNMVRGYIECARWMRDKIQGGDNE